MAVKPYFVELVNGPMDGGKVKLFGTIPAEIFTLKEVPKAHTEDAPVDWTVKPGKFYRVRYIFDGSKFVHAPLVGILP